MPGGHPTDAQREADALPVLLAVVGAARAGDADTLRQSYAEDAVWLAPGRSLHGADAAAARHLEIAALAEEWDEPQQQGAKAALRWTGGGGASHGAVVVEVRRGRIIFAAEG
ncbi:MAG: nuclear transport factor 2 family protein [Thermoleophilia bacterium]